MDFEGESAVSATTSSKLHGLPECVSSSEKYINLYFTGWSLSKAEASDCSLIIRFGADDAWTRDFILMICKLPRHKV